MSGHCKAHFDSSTQQEAFILEFLGMPLEAVHI